MKKARLFHRIGTGVIIGCFLAASLSCSMFQPKGKASVSIDPPIGIPGTAIKITGSGFRAGEEVDIVLILGEGLRIGLGTQKIETITADPNGGFSVASNIPGMAKPGRYGIEVEGSKGSYAKSFLEVVKKK